MANTNVTRSDSFFTKKLLSQMVVNIDFASKSPDGAIGPLGNYLVARLPEHCVLQNAYVFTTKAGTGTVDVGTTEGGAEIVSAASVASTGLDGTLVSNLYTGTGIDIYMELSAAVGNGEFYVVIEYLELGVDTGSMTRI